MLDDMMDGLEKAVNWLDALPTVPAAAGAFALGLFVPTNLLILSVVVAVGYVLFKFITKD